MGQTWRNGRRSFARLQEPQFRRPVHQCQAQALIVRMPGAELTLDVRDLLAAARDSRRPLPTFRGDLLERASVAVKLGLFARQRLPALHNDIDVLRI